VDTWFRDLTGETDIIDPTRAKGRFMIHAVQIAFAAMTNVATILCLSDRFSMQVR
jgi:hypothetical protein